MLIGSLLLTLVGCASETLYTEPDVSAVSNTELHGIMTNYIGALMSQIDVLEFDQHRTELELDRERRAKAVQIAEAARQLSRAAEMILAVQPELDLSAERVAVFSALAGKLNEHGAELKDLAMRNQYEALGTAIDNTLETCNTCHRLYRGF